MLISVMLIKKHVNDNARGPFNSNSQTNFKTWMLKSSSCNYSDAYIIVKRTISTEGQAENNPNNSNEKVVFKNCASFTDSRSEITNIWIDNAEEIDVVIAMYDSIEYSNNL